MNSVCLSGGRRVRTRDRCEGTSFVYPSEFAPLCGVCSLCEEVKSKGRTATVTRLVLRGPVGVRSGAVSFVGTRIEQSLRLGWKCY